MKKTIIFFLFAIFFLQFANAQESLGTFKLGSNINLIQNCANSSYSYISSLLYPDSSFAISSQASMTKNVDNYNYTFNKTNFNGQYLVYGQCDEYGTPTNWGYSFQITKSGYAPASDFLEVFIYILFIIVTLSLFTTFIILLAKLATFEITLYNVLISWGIYILTIITNYLGKNYLMNNLVEDMTNGYLTYTAWTNVVFPLLAFIVVFFIRSMQKKKPMSVKELSGRLLRD